MINSKNNQQIVISGVAVMRENRNKRQWLVVKQKEESDWELPKVTVRKGESSVRAAIRLTGEQAGMTARILEEAGRGTGSTTINSKTVPQKFYYYLMLLKAGGQEAIGFTDFKWLEYADAVKKLWIKKEKDVLKSAKDTLKEWEKTHSTKKQFIEEV